MPSPPSTACCRRCAATDLKRLLAYSTTENLGLIFVGVGAAGLFAATGNRALAGLLMVAALLHAVNHAAFKTLLFLGAGSVLRSTTLRDLDKMGGLARPMPVTTALFGIGALGCLGPPARQRLRVRVAAPAGTDPQPATVRDAGRRGGDRHATGRRRRGAHRGAGVATFVKAFGVGFLARPRSAEAMAATEVPRTMRVGMGLAALACGVLALAPVPVVRSVQRVLSGMRRSASDARCREPWTCGWPASPGRCRPC